MAQLGRQFLTFKRRRPNHDPLWSRDCDGKCGGRLGGRPLYFAGTENHSARSATSSGSSLGPFAHLKTELAAQGVQNHEDLELAVNPFRLEVEFF